MSVSDFQKTVHQTAQEKGFWVPNANLAEKVALIHSELSELLEAYRGDPQAPCDKSGCPLTKEEEEMADVFIRLMDLAEYRGIDLEEAARVKHQYNLSRPHKHGGRKF